MDFTKNHVAVLLLQKKEELQENLHHRYEIARFILEYLFQEKSTNLDKDEIAQEEVLVEFSVLELKNKFESAGLFNKATSKDIENALFTYQKSKL